MNCLHLSNENELELTFSKHLTFNEKRLIKDIKNNKNTLQLDLNYFYYTFSFSSIDEIELFLIKFSEKYLIIKNIKKENKYYIPLLNSFYFENNKVILLFSDYILKSFEIGTFFNKIGLNKILILDEKYSYKLFYLINISKNPSIKINIEIFKNMFNIKDKYKRFYDMEKNIILPIINDINNNSDFFISYNKIKRSNHCSSKIIELEFYKKISKNNDENEIIDEIMNSIKNKISNFSEIHSLLLKNLSLYGKSYISKVIDETLKKAPNNFENHLKNILIKKEDFLIPVKRFEKKFNSLFELHIEILNILKVHKNLKKISALNFLLKLYSLKEKETFFFDYQDISFKIIYNKKEASIIEILNKD